MEQPLAESEVTIATARLLAWWKQVADRITIKKSNLYAHTNTLKNGNKNIYL